MDRRTTLAIAAVVLLLGACAPVPGPSPSVGRTTNVGSPGATTAAASDGARSDGRDAAGSASARPATTRLRVDVDVRELCGSIGGCAVYGKLERSGVANAQEVELGVDGGGLPTLIPAGSYVVRFRYAAVSDVQSTGGPRLERTLTTCALPIEVELFHSSVEVLAVFDLDACYVNSSYALR